MNQSHTMQEAAPHLRKKVKAAILLYGVLLAFWLAFSGYFSFFFIGAGIVCVGVCVMVTIRMGLLPKARPPLYIRGKSLAYAGWLAREIVRSSMDVARIIWQVTPDISPRLARIRSMPKNEVGKALYANSITLTPGTLCVAVETDHVIIHALREEGIIGLEEGVMDSRTRAVSLLAK